MHTKKSTNTVVAKSFNKQRKRTKTSVELFTLTCYYDVRIFQIQCFECLHDLLNKHVQLTSVVKLMNAFGLSKGLKFNDREAILIVGGGGDRRVGGRG